MVDEPTEYVDQYISGSTHTINVNDTIQQARKIMNTKNTNFLVVTEDSMPTHILKRFQTLGVKPNTQIRSLAQTGKLKPAEIVESGTPWSNVAPRLRYDTVIVVMDTTTKAPQIRGTVSTYNVKWQAR